MFNRLNLYCVFVLLMFFSVSIAFAGDFDEKFLEASKKGNLEEVQSLIQEGANLEAMSENGSTSLMYAIENGSFDIVCALVEAGAGIGDVDYDALYAGTTEHVKIAEYLLEKVEEKREHNQRLLEAASNGNLSEVKKALTDGASINFQGNYGESLGSALMFAVTNNHRDVLNFLIETGANVNDIVDEEAVLMAASAAGNLEVLRILIEAGADVNASTDWGYSALLGAAHAGHVDVARALLEAGAVSMTDEGGGTPLVYAASAGKTEMVRLLIEFQVSDLDDVPENMSGALQSAAFEGYIDIVRILLEAGAHVDLQDSSGETALMHASRAGQIDVVRTLLEAGADVNIPNNNYLTTLIAAAEEGHIDIVRILLDAGVNVRAQNKDGVSALHIATFLDDPFEMVTVIVKAGADVNAMTNDENTPLIYAVRGKSFDVVNLLLTSKADVDVRNSQGSTALLEAANAGNLEYVRALVEAGADTGIKNTNKQNAFLVAVKNKNVEIEDYLMQQKGGADIALLEYIRSGDLIGAKKALAFGANVKMTDEFEITLLMEAAHSRSSKMVDLLLKAGATEIANKKHGTALLCAVTATNYDAVPMLLNADKVRFYTSNMLDTAMSVAFSQGSTSMVSFLLEAEIAVKTKNISLKQPFVFAAKDGNLDDVRKFLASGVDINEVDSDGNTALMHATEENHLEVVRFLIKSGADVNKYDKYKLTALSGVAYVGHYEMVEILVEAGANLNSQDKYKETPLMQAAERGHLDVVELLVDEGADIHAASEDADTAVILAAKNGHASIVEFLLDEGADVHTVGAYGENLLICAIGSKDIDTVDVVIKAGADINKTRNNKTQTPLIIAVIKGVIPIVELLIEEDADLNAIDKHGYNAFMHGAGGGDIEIMELLLEEGVDMNTVNKYGDTALDVAKGVHRQKSIELLTKLGAKCKE